jgi:hypothetical protein
MIPHNITRKHILQALEKIDQDGVPPNRSARGYELRYLEKRYPPKYVVALANKYANGYFLSSDDFGGGSETNDFLASRGFSVLKIASNLPPTIKTAPVKMAAKIKPTHHNERCKACKGTIRLLLQKLYGRVELNYDFDIGALPENYRDLPAYDSLLAIFHSLQNYRGHQSFVRTTKLPRVDFYIPEPGFVVEFDESQHFTVPRKIALQGYPDGLRLGFDKNKWIKTCETTNASDNTPPYRDEQRAWYDTLRDFLPSSKSLHPTVRLYSKSLRWCSLNPDNPADLERFRIIIEGASRDWKIEFHKDPNPAIARIIIAGEWDGKVEVCKKLLDDVCAAWPGDMRTHILVTCGAFLTFGWPESMPQIIDNKFPDKWVTAKLIAEAENHCRQLVDEEMRQKLLAVTDFITIGVDSSKAKISVSSAQIQRPHVEMVALVDLRTGSYHWTGKSYPTPGQEKGLVRFQDLSSHFVSLPFGRVMVLGCHDLNIFSRRGQSTTKAPWRKSVRDEFYQLAKSEKPTIVLHHPHTTDNSQIWTAAWNELTQVLPTVDMYVGSGRYYNNGAEQRSSLIGVLQKTKKGNTLDIVIWA